MRFYLRFRLFPAISAFLLCIPLWAQNFNNRDLLLNGGFEDINTCSEYNAQCGVEGWFYLINVKAEMRANRDQLSGLGNNLFAISYPSSQYSGFTPLIGSILPCKLQKGKQYIFSGVISMSQNNLLLLTPGVVMGERYFVPRRSFSKEMVPDTIIHFTKLSLPGFFGFRYEFTATGAERYLTFGAFTEEDPQIAKTSAPGDRDISIVLDNFQLVPVDKDEVVCNEYDSNKIRIYQYDFRHKIMDNTLFSRGELPVQLDWANINSQTIIKQAPTSFEKPAPDTLTLGDVFFDFNKADLKNAALLMLQDYFRRHSTAEDIDSIYLDGHTDSVGSQEKNLVLSVERCKTVKSWLLKNHVVADDRAILRPFGKSRPLASNNSPQGRATNRRVEIIIFKRK